MLTCLDRDGSVLDTDKSVWFQGRAGWMFATLCNTASSPSPPAGESNVESPVGALTPHPHSLSPPRGEGGWPGASREQWLAAARSCVEFSRRHCHAPGGKMYFSVTREGKPLRMRRYVFSEAFSAIANAAFAKASGEARAAEDATRNFAAYLRHSFEPGVMTSKFEATRPMKGIAAHMIGIVTAQELRANLGDIAVSGRTCTEWIDRSIAEIERDFLKPEHEALMEVVAPDGGVIDHFDGRTLNPGHALECAWFILHEGALRKDTRLIKLGTTILDWMWKRGWDEEFGGLLYFTDVFGRPVQEYWHDMKFWWPHCEALIATLLAWKLTGAARYAEMHRRVHEWSFRHFPDAEHGEWFGYLHRDGRVSQRAKGNLFKGPFHLPRMLWYCGRLLEA
ncbi:MAG: AGE family epimerase/isomerase [Verrucomicrobia bacterium]|nr:AGE family epimerase/isomerase [Verrucomicrobiota bacterium]